VAIPNVVVVFGSHHYLHAAPKACARSSSKSRRATNGRRIASQTRHSTVANDGPI
jgi:hypothetical protein